MSQVATAIVGALLSDRNFMDGSELLLTWPDREGLTGYYIIGAELDYGRHRISPGDARFFCDWLIRNGRAMDLQRMPAEVGWRTR